MLKKTFQRLNALSKINSASKYLEIGVHKGNTFTQVDIPQKIAVDPQFQFDVQNYSNQNTIFHEVTSDFFFSTLASEHGRFDLIYLDGLHTFEQTFRDFCASLSNSHSQTIWLIDDTYPINWLAASPNPSLVRRLRKFRKYLGIKKQGWMGDVFKVVFAIHDFFPQFSYATFPGQGQTVVWLEPRNDFTPTWNSLEKISRLRYWDFLKFRDSHMSILEPSKILESVEKSMKNK
jgi:hypothetical protein